MIKPNAPGELVRALLLASGLLNAAFFAKYALFDPNVEYKPVCDSGYSAKIPAPWLFLFLNSLKSSRVYLEGQMTRDFRDSVRHWLERVGYRIDADGRVYVSRWIAWRQPSLMADATSNVVHGLYFNRPEAYRLPPDQMPDDRPSSLDSTNCDVVRAVAIEQEDASGS